MNIIFRYIYIILSTNLLFVNYSFSQELIISKDIDLQSVQMYDLLGRDDGDIILYQAYKSKFFIDLFSNDLSHVKNWRLLEKYQNPHILGVGLSEGINVAYNFKIKHNHYLRFDKYDKLGILLDSVSIKHDFYNKDYFRLQTSDDESVCCVFRINSSGLLSIWVVDMKHLSIMWTYETKVKNLNRELFKKLIVNNNGDVAILIKRNRSLFSSNSNTKYLLLNINKDQYHESELVLDGFLLSNLNMDFYTDKPHVVYINGYYSDNNNKEYNGISYIDIDLFNVEQEYFMEFLPFDMLTLKEFYKSGNIYNYINNIQVTNFISTEDSGYLIIGEVEHRIFRNSRGIRYTHGASSRQWTDFYNKDIIVTAYNLDNSLRWSRVIPKNQYSQDEQKYYSSFFLFKNDSFIKFLFNDDVNRNSTVSDYTLNPLGNYKRATVLNTVGKDLNLRFRNAEQISHNEILVPSQLGHILNIVKIKF